jgi:hypothetical protein
MSLTISQVGSTYSGNAASVTTGTITASAGDLILVVGATNHTFVSMTSSDSGTWNQAVSDGFSERIFWRNFTGSASFTVTWTQGGGTGLGYGVAVYRVTGADPTTPIGATGSNRLNSTQNYTPTVFTSTSSSSLMLVGAYDLNDKGTPSSSDLTYSAYDTAGSSGFIDGLTGYKSITSIGSQTANLNAAAASPSWCYVAVEILPGPLSASVSTTSSVSTTATANTTSPAGASTTTSVSSTVTANVTSPASVSSTTTVSSTVFAPVPQVSTTTTVSSTVTATATPPQLANVATTTSISSTVTATGLFGANVVSSTVARSTVTATRSGAIPPMGVYGPLTIGRLTLTESPESASKAAAGARTLSVAGQEASAALAASQAAARDRAEGLVAYDGQTVPVQFTANSHLNGWYQVSSPEVDETTWVEQTAIRWKCDLQRIGFDAEVEIESRLIGGNRSHASSAVAEIWHAPSIGHDSYMVGATSPGYVSRNATDGNVIVYRGLPSGSNPRWGVTSENYLAGAASVTVNGVLRTGTTCSDTPASWQLSNGLIRVEPRTSTGTLLVTSYLTSSWGTPKVFDLKRGTTSLGPAQHVTILRNDPCEVLIRLTWDHAPGRTTADLSLKRGSRFVGVYVTQYTASSPLRIDDTLGTGTVSNQLTGSGFIATTTSDGDGNQWVIGSAVACTAAGTFGLAANVTAQGLPAYIGCVAGGASALAGDLASDVNAQYLGAPTETERMILR